MIRNFAALIILLFAIYPMSYASDAVLPDSNVVMNKPIEINLSGPRFGISAVTNGSEIADDLRDKSIEPVFTQFGWQFEYTATPIHGGHTLMFDVIGLVGGMEQGVFLPSLSGMMGFRTRDGYEFGIGPNISLAGGALGVAVGRSFDYGGINIPINLAVMTSPKGTRFTLVTGFALRIGK